jgi:hypothetical protein
VSVNIKKIVIAGGLAALTCLAQGFQISSLSPQGEVARVRQVVAKFDESAVTFGDPKAPAPLSLTCSDAQATRGAGRWLSDREWVFDFEHDLPPACAARCNCAPASPPPRQRADRQHALPVQQRRAVCAKHPPLRRQCH